MSSEPRDPAAEPPSGPESHLAAELDRARGRARLTQVAVTAGAVALLCWLVVDPVSRQESHLYRGVLAGLGIALVWARLAIHRLGAGEGAVRALWAALAAVCVIGWFNYFQFDRKVLTGINDYTDTSYYYTNSKYLAELGYDGLYAAALLCDEERGAPRTSHLVQIRDLRDDELRSRADGLRHGVEVKAAFAPERWTSFCHDITYFLDRLDRGALRDNWFVDHGYNPPPTWTVVGGNLSELVRVEQIKSICMVDAALVALMFVCVGWAFGFEALAFAMLFWVVTFSGRWPILGMAILRFDWVAALVVGVCLLRVGRYGGAGAALAYAALNRVFPAIFLWGWLVEAVIDTVREGRLPRKHVRFAAGAAVMSALLVGTAAVQYGPKTLVDSASSLTLHNESFSSHRVGLGTVLVWKGETTRPEIRANGGMYRKELKVRSMKWGLRGAGVLALGLIAAAAWQLARRGRPVPAWELVAWTTAPLYCATTPQVNYYNFRAVSYLWHASRLEELVHAALLSVLLASEVVSQLAQWSETDRHAVNALSSWVMLVYFVGMAAAIALRIGRLPRSAGAQRVSARRALAHAPRHPASAGG